MNLSWKLPVEHLSATSLAKAIQCPEAWRQRYLLKQKDSLSGDQFLGIVDHAAHEINFAQKIVTGKDLPLDDLKRSYIEKWTETIDDEGEPDWRDQEPSEMYKRGLNAVELYHTEVSPRVNPLGVEEKIEFSIKGMPFPIIGYLDVVTKDRVIDRKTAKNKLSKPKSGWRFQAKIYSYASELPVEFQIVTKQVTPQVVTAQEAPALLLMPANPRGTEQLILATVRMLNDHYCRYGADEPWPTLGQLHDWLCQWCSFGPNAKASCPAWAGVVEEPTVALA